MECISVLKVVNEIKIYLWLVKRLQSFTIKILKFAEATTVVGLIPNIEEISYCTEVGRLAAWCAGSSLKLKETAGNPEPGVGDVGFSGPGPKNSYEAAGGTGTGNFTAGWNMFGHVETESCSVFDMEKWYQGKWSPNMHEDVCWCGWAMMKRCTALTASCTAHKLYLQHMQ